MTEDERSAKYRELEARLLEKYPVYHKYRLYICLAECPQCGARRGQACKGYMVTTHKARSAAARKRIKERPREYRKLREQISRQRAEINEEYRRIREG